MLIFKDSFEKKLQHRIAFLAIGRSALRNQGASGLLKKSRDFCSILDLEQMAIIWNKGNFKPYLDRVTQILMKSFPKKAKNNFGATRKALNLFFRDVIYCNFLSKHFGLRVSKKLLSQLEVPLDSYTTKGIYIFKPTLKPLWKGIRYLSPTVSNEFQKTAAIIAAKNKIVRVHLDVFYWREGK